MKEHLIFLSIPALRPKDVDDPAAMPNLRRLMAGGDRTELVPSFPCVTCPVQANMMTGQLPDRHGVVANGFYWREKRQVEMWTAWNPVIEAPQVWDLLHQRRPGTTSAAWFALNIKGAGADYICTPAPIHNPDGTEDLWCYTKPTELYGELKAALGHFPLQHFWGPLANIKSTQWIVESAAHALKKFRPNFFYIYLPHLDYAAQKHGPDSPEAHRSLSELDACIGRLAEGVEQAGLTGDTVLLAASEYVITPVRGALFPNRILRQAGLLQVRGEADHELLDFAASRAFALVDHQFAHVFVQDPRAIDEVAQLFRGTPGIAEVLAGNDRARYHLEHPRSGEVILIAEPDRWLAYYWWLDDALAPPFARSVDIHRKPGYDPVELFFDPATRSIPLDPTLVKGSHGAPATDSRSRGVVLASCAAVLPDSAQICDVEMAMIALRCFGVSGR